MMEKKASDSMTQHVTLGLKNIISSKFNKTLGPLYEGIWSWIQLCMLCK